MTDFVSVWWICAALATAIVLVLLARRVALWLPAHFGVPLSRGRGTLALEQVLPLDARRRLVLVRCGERRLLLLTGGAQDVALGWLDAPPAGWAP